MFECQVTIKGERHEFKYDTDKKQFVIEVSPYSEKRFDEFLDLVLYLITK